ncbi:DUF4282 domain-containing protein [Skermania sp. ID1734]|uniref:DUF4282 domain-containing protein n=1 Tax=Skermania sp. ID1734 TaxID=2597516 RepID=UPI00117CD02A|nr:DUF4282 domain-containing protein [Skermania sp. ID1734]TSE01611.1 DUF4282 domain-containing protein [Skermania sp. ID1734]
MSDHNMDAADAAKTAAEGVVEGVKGAKGKAKQAAGAVLGTDETGDRAAADEDSSRSKSDSDVGGGGGRNAENSPSKQSPAPVDRPEASEPRETPGVSFLRGIFDFKFKTTLTERLTPSIYAAGLLLAVAVPVWFGLSILHSDLILGILFLCIAGPVIFFGLAALIRVALEFFVAMRQFVRQFQELVGLARSLQTSMDNLDVPMSNVGELIADLQSLQFWRRSGKPEKPLREEDSP